MNQKLVKINVLAIFSLLVASFSSSVTAENEINTSNAAADPIQALQL